ncbi:hypothetical protein, partial [Alicyclobacillus kakegawensis]|uniref:hypothetical protein n=1 Tax=Alicyclobacillus kakegawensis TaxID=392012 RepID=UPI00146FE9FF
VITTYWNVNAYRIDLFTQGELEVTSIQVERAEDKVPKATYFGIWHKLDGTSVPAYVDACFIDPVEPDVDAILRAGWHTWRIGLIEAD